MCVCHILTPPPLGCVYVCGQGVVGSGNVQSAALVPESSVTARLRPISTLDLIVFRKGAGPAVSFTSCDRCPHKGIQYRGMVTAEGEELYT